MNTRTIAAQALNPVGLGCMNVAWTYGPPESREAAVALFRHALDAGCDHFDVANIYGGGLCEEMLGEAIMHRRDEFFLATKTGIVVDGPARGIDCHPDSIVASIDGSLKRLGTDHVDLFYMHRFDPKVPIADSVGAMVRLIEAGKIGGYGVSEWSAAHVREAHAVHPMAAAQHEFSLWSRNVELGVLQATRELGIALVAFSPVGRGALAADIDVDALTEQDLRRRMPRFLGEEWQHNRAVLRAFADLAAEAGMAPAQLALGWVLAQGDHVHAIPGTRSVAHFEENSDASRLALSPGLLARADALVNPQTIRGHRYPTAIRGTIDTEEYAT
ncbi:MAG TPA: aldo/keto reductase [Croceicoccus sp.]|nr:aldo/keto reductase [Croceicoccus sp.]